MSHSHKLKVADDASDDVIIKNALKMFPVGSQADMRKTGLHLSTHLGEANMRQLLMQLIIIIDDKEIERSDRLGAIHAAGELILAYAAAVGVDNICPAAASLARGLRHRSQSLGADQ